MNDFLKKLFPLKKTYEEDLKIFFMAVRTNPNHLGIEPGKEKFIGVVAYRHDDAIKKAGQVYGADWKTGLGVYSNGDFETIANLFATIDGPELRKLIKDELNEQEPPKKMAPETFKASLLLTAEEYVSDPNDRKELKRIVQNVRFIQPTISEGNEGGAR